MSRKRAICSKSVFGQNEEPPNKKIFNPSAKQVESSAATSKSLNFSQNFDLNKSKLNVSKLTNFQANSANWIDNFAPAVVDDLAVNTAKIKEIRDWLKHCEIIKKKQSAGQIALITGPSGAGKTASVRLIAKEMQYELVEWINPLDLDLVSLNEAEVTYKESQIEIFKRFLFRSSRYKSLFESMTKRLILVEDFPNTFTRSPEGFTEILQCYKEYGKSPLIFIATDSKARQLNISYNLFPDNVRNQFQIQNISFNPISTTLMKKAVKRICNLMDQAELRKLYKPPNQDTIDSICMTAQGDIRNAVINIHFASLKGAPNLQTELLKNEPASGQKSRVKTNRKLSKVGRDESITMMHALGRVFNPKYNEQSKNLTHSPEEITEGFTSEPKHFVDFIFTNYISHFSSIENVLGGIDNLSHSDALMSEYRDAQLGILGLNLAIRGIMVNNANPVRAWLPIKGPKRNKEEQSHQLELASYGIVENISRHVLASEYRSYAKLIINQKKPDEVIK